jgi:hypothetical protein
MRNILIDFPEIQIELEKLFNLIPEKLKENCQEERLKSSKLSLKDINKICVGCNVNLPDSFKDILLRYDLGDLTLGGIWFGSKENFVDYILNHNAQNQHYPWWGNENRPNNYLLVADSDGYLILLNTQTEEIFAFLRSESFDKAQLIANKFDLFFRAAATIYIYQGNLAEGLTTNIVTSLEELMTNITTSLECSNDSDFWEEIIN